MGGVALALLAILILGGAGIYLLLKILKNFRPGRNKIQKDLSLIKAELQPWLSDLIPWSKEEMEQLSLNQVNRSVKKRVVNTAKGIFTTIYHEPVIAWAYKKYVSPKENALIYARTTDHEFIYRVKNEEVELVINNKLVGNITANGTLLPAGKGTNTLAQINRQTDELLLPVLVNGREVGSLAKPGKNSKSNPRAFQFISKMNKEEEELFLSLAVLEMVRRGI